MVRELELTFPLSIPCFLFLNNTYFYTMFFYFYYYIMYFIFVFICFVYCLSPLEGSFHKGEDISVEPSVPQTMPSS